MPNGIEYKEVNVLEDVLPERLLYMTRVQRERFFNEGRLHPLEGQLHP